MTLAFRIGPIPVRIQIWFLCALLGLALCARRGLGDTAAWALALFATAGAHEVAHVLAARAFGLPAEVHLSLSRVGLGFPMTSISPLRRMAVWLAGPCASLALSAVIFAVARLNVQPVAGVAWRYFGWMNLGWGLLHCVPILPLDAGQATVALLDRVTHGRGELPVRWLSIASASLLGLAAGHHGMMLLALTCGIVGFSNVRALRPLLPSERAPLMRLHLQAAYDALVRGDAQTAIAHCHMVLGGATTSAVRTDAVRLLAYAEASMDRWGDLIELFESGAAGSLADHELEKYERAAREMGRPSEAQRIAILRSKDGSSGRRPGGETHAAEELAKHGR